MMRTGPCDRGIRARVSRRRRVAAGQHHSIIIAGRQLGSRSESAGLALSGTVHWMFDRGLVSLGGPPDYPILLSRQALPDSVRRLFNPDMLLRKPADQRSWHASLSSQLQSDQVFFGGLCGLAHPVAVPPDLRLFDPGRDNLFALTE
jgi:hypothetical protein